MYKLDGTKDGIAMADGWYVTLAYSTSRGMEDSCQGQAHIELLRCDHGGGQENGGKLTRG